MIVLLALAAVQRDARTLNVARTLADAGHDVLILAAGSLDGCCTTEAQRAHMRLLSWSDPGGSALRRWLSFNAFVARQSIASISTIGAMDLFALKAARSLQRRTQARLVYDAREFYFSLGPLEGKGWKQRLLSMMERRLIRHATVVTVSGPLDATIIRDRYGLAALPTVILNTPPYREKVPSRALRQRCAIPVTSPILLYQGVVHHGRGIRPTIDALVLLPRMHFCIIGTGPAQEELQRYAIECGVDNRVHWVGAVDYHELHELTCSADVGMCVIEPVSKSYEYALPNKLFEYIMAEIPVVFSALPALRATAGTYRIGVMVDVPLQPEAIAAAVEEALDKEYFGPSLHAAAMIFSYEKEREKVLCTY